MFCHTCFRTGFHKFFHWIGWLVWCFWHIAQFNLRWSLRDATTLDGMTLTIRVTLSFLAPSLVIILCGCRQCVWRWIQQWSILRHPCKQHWKIQIDLQWMWGYTDREREHARPVSISCTCHEWFTTSPSSTPLKSEDSKMPTLLQFMEEEALELPMLTHYYLITFFLFCLVTSNLTNEKSNGWALWLLNLSPCLSRLHKNAGA